MYIFNPKHVRQIFQQDGNTPNRPQIEVLDALQKKLNLKESLLTRYYKIFNPNKAWIITDL